MFSKTSVINTNTVIDYLLVVALIGGQYDKAKDNYYKAGKLYFHKYKTSDKVGLQVLNELNKIIKKWNKKMDLNSYIKQSFGKRVSVDMLRHIFLTDLYKGMPNFIDMEKTAKEMSLSLMTALTYVKRD